MSPLVPANWPEHAVHFNATGIALVQIDLPKDAREAARTHSRKALRQILAELSPAGFELIETGRGPVIRNSEIRISLSYAGNRCLIGLCTGRKIGVDIVRIENFEGIEEVSRLYLSRAAQDAIRKEAAESRPERFALCWAQMEAASKCLGLALCEITSEREATLDSCEQIDCAQNGPYRIALAVK